MTGSAAHSTQEVTPGRREVSGCARPRPAGPRAERLRPGACAMALLGGRGLRVRPAEAARLPRPEMPARTRLLSEEGGFLRPPK